MRSDPLAQASPRTHRSRSHARYAMTLHNPALLDRSNDLLRRLSKGSAPARQLRRKCPRYDLAGLTFLHPSTSAGYTLCTV